MNPADLPATMAMTAPKRLPFLRSLRARFMALALAGLVPFAGISVDRILDERRAAEAAALANAAALAREAAARLDDHWQKIEAVLAVVGVAIEPDLGAPERLDEHLRTLHRTLSSEFHDLSVLSPEGRMIGAATVPPTVRLQLDFSAAPFLRTAVGGRRFAVSEPLAAKTSATRIIVAARPIVNATGAVRAVVVAGTSLAAVERIANSDLVPPTARVSVHLADGTPIAGGAAALDAAAASQLFARGGTAREEAGAGEPVLAAYARPNRTDWLLRIEVPKSAALARVDDHLRSELAVVLAACLGIALATLWLGSRISQPLERLRMGAARLAAGELDHRVADGGESEVAQLARDFNTMAADLDRERRALVESEERWQFALEGAGAGVWDWNVPTGRMFHSPRAWEILGIRTQPPVSDYLEWGWRIHPQDAAAVRAATRTLLKQPGATAMIEYRMRHADGGWRWIEGRGTAVVRDASGRAQRLIGTSTDITDRKLAEARLARLGRMLAALNAVNEAIARVGSPADLYRRFCEIAAGHSDLNCATIRLIDDARGCLVLVAQSGQSAANIGEIAIPDITAEPAPRRAAVRALREGRVAVTNDIRVNGDTEWGARGLADGLLATVSCPVRRSGRVVGVLSLYASEAGYFDAELVALIERMGESLSFALDNFDRESERRAAEGRLRASEERFRALTELSSDFYWETDSAHRFAQLVYGPRHRPTRSAGAQIGLPRWEIPSVYPDAAGWQLHRAGLDAHHPFRDFEFARADTEGGVRWYVIGGEPMFDADGAFVGYRGVGRDITDRKLADLAARQLLAEKEALADRLRGQFESMPIGCMLFDDQHRVSYANPAAERIFGVPAAELLGVDIADRYIDPGMRQAIAVRRKRLEANEEVGPMVIRFQRPEGEARQCEVHSTALRSDGKLTGVIRMLIDVTDRERAQAALYESESRYRSLIEVAPDGIVLVSDDRIQYANDAMARIMHTANADDLLGRPFADLFVGEEREAVAGHLERLEHEVGPSARAERQLMALDGQSVEVDIRANSYRWNDRVYVQATIRDNSVRKAIHRRVLEINVELERRVDERTAELQAANRELEAFSYSVAHDLRAPLRAIDGFTRILAADLGDRLDASLRRSLDRVHVNVARMAQLIDDLLAFARIGRRELELVEVDTGALCRAVGDELRSAYPKAELRLAELPVVRGDPTLLRQVFANLIGNALKFSARAERPLVEIGCELAHGDHIFHVRDNGVGFSMEYAHKLFGVFQRLHGPQEFEGTGVGLAIVQRALQRHHGRPWADGEPGKGATFYFALPA